MQTFLIEVDLFIMEILSLEIEGSAVIELDLFIINILSQKIVGFLSDVLRVTATKVQTRQNLT